MHGHFKKNFIFYVVIGLGSMYLINNAALPSGNYNFLQTSFVSILENVLQNQKFEPVDLGIEKVTLKKIADPRSDFNFNKYAANIVITNYGGDLKNGQVILQAGNDEKHVFLKNDEQGFSLKKGQSYIVENYELLFNGDYNGGKLSVEIKLPDKADYYTGNNKYDVDVLAMPAKINALKIDEIKNDGTIKLNFDAGNFSTVSDDFELYESDVLNFDVNDSTYAETRNTVGERLYGYRIVKNSEDLLKNANWIRRPHTNSNPHFVKFSTDPFAESATRYFYVKAVHPDTGNYVVSDIIALIPQKLAKPILKTLNL